MTKKYESFEVLTIGREFLRQKPNMQICKIADVIGIKMFSQILLLKSLQGMLIRFPRQSTLRKIYMRAVIRDSLKHLNPKSSKFQIQLKELAKLFGINKCQVREEYNLVRGRKSHGK